jgi:N-acetyl-alpha-D-glucosaminyl L-malate synthase BshA
MSAIGIACHSSFGGSVVVATELSNVLAERGHQVHVFAAEAPPRLELRAKGISFHQIKSPLHPLFPSGEYALALASQIAQVAHAAGLEVMHVHYGIPHATSAMLAQQMLGRRALKTVTTLHGTDVLTLGLDPAFFGVLRHSILHCDAVTVPSAYLKVMAEQNFSWPRDKAPIEVIANSVDVKRFRPAPTKDWERLASLFPAASFSPMPKVLIHNSNFRSLKRTDEVVRIFARVSEQVPSLLVFIGDGPDRAETQALVAQLKLERSVCFMGEQADVPWLLQSSDVFILPSETESFGLAALEALSCGVPVVATAVGGLPELISDATTGFLHAVGEVEAMSRSVVKLLRDDGLRAQFAAAARARVEQTWQRGPMVDRYEALYRSLQ